MTDNKILNDKLIKEFNPQITDDFGNEGVVLFERMTGSRMYGTSYEKGEHPFNPDYESDYDFRGMFMVDPFHKIKLAPFNKFSETLKLEEHDSEMYEVQKFFFEAAKNNPNYMDLLFGDEETLIGSTEKGDFLLEQKNFFLSNKIADSFSGYARSQLDRMKNHNKWFNTYPDIYDVENTLKKAYSNQETDHDMISSLFSGQLAYAISSEDPNSKKKISLLTKEDMISKYFANKKYDVRKYMKPHVFEYINVRNNKGKRVDFDDSVKNFLMNEATFETSNKSLYFVYGGGTGMISQSDRVYPKPTAPILESEDIRFIVTVDMNRLKKDEDHIKDLWSWKINRNPTRSALEERFGYDVKHGMHTYRLLDSAIDVLLNGTYNPRLSGQRLQNAKDILAGQWSYDRLLKEAYDRIKTLQDLKRKQLLPEEVNQNKLAEIYNEIVFNK